MHCEWQFAVAIILYINVETKWQESLAAHMVQLMNPVPGVTCLSSDLPSNVLLRQINLMNPWVPPCFAHRDSMNECKQLINIIASGFHVNAPISGSSIGIGSSRG